MNTRRERPAGRRVGLIVPSVNTVIEPDLAWAAPAGVTFHSTRVMLRETTPEDLRAMNAGVAAATELIAQISPDVVAFACTSGSFIDGAEGMRKLVAAIEAVAGCPVVATSDCMIAAIKTLGIRALSLATPYLEAVNEAEAEFLRGQGLTLTAVAGLGLSGKAIREVPPGEVEALVRRVDRPESEAVFVSCTDFRALEVIDALERELGKPVLSSNQVTLWGILRALGLPTAVRGFGRLMS